MDIGDRDFLVAGLQSCMDAATPHYEKFAAIVVKENIHPTVVILAAFMLAKAAGSAIGMDVDNLTLILKALKLVPLEDEDLT